MTDRPSLKSQMKGSSQIQPVIAGGAEPYAVRKRPILFSAPMVRAILDGRKTQTRRVVKPQPIVSPEGYWSWSPHRAQGLHHGQGGSVSDLKECLPLYSPYGRPGDLLWVRETFRLDVAYDNKRPSAVSSRAATWFEADQTARGNGVSGKTRVSIHMPRWASRITLRITDVRVERLNDCSEADAIAEGADCLATDGEGAFYLDVERGSYRMGYAGLWDHINGPGAWDANPWVWAVTFERAEPTKEAASPAQLGPGPNQNPEQPQ